jgi:CIC family chloride channel protein
VALAAPLVGGIFAPSLFLGASLGAALGHLLAGLLPGAGIDPGAYALVGMGAFFAGFLRTPIASVLIVFELTGGYELVAPLMLAVALSSLLAHRFAPATLVERQLAEAGIVIEEGGDPLAHRRVRDAMVSAVCALPATQTVSRARREAPAHRMYPVVDAAGLCVGVLARERLLAAADATPEDPVSRHADPALVLATPDEPLDRLSLRLGAAGETRCPVVESRSRPRLVGFLTPADILRARVRASVEDDGPEFSPF